MVLVDVNPSTIRHRPQVPAERTVIVGAQMLECVNGQTKTTTKMQSTNIKLVQIRIYKISKDVSLINNKITCHYSIIQVKTKGI
jgi:hypothetical protein